MLPSRFIGSVLLLTMLSRRTLSRFVGQRLLSTRASLSRFASSSHFNADDPAAVPTMPTSFTENFQLPQYMNPLPLERINAHPLDAKIQFEEKTHTYKFEGKVMERSVTTLVESCFEVFDALAVIKKMKAGSNWPRAEYMTRTGVPWSDAQIVQKWNLTGLYARNNGTWMHWNIERALNGYAVCPDLVEMNLFNDFFDQQLVRQQIEPYRTEWRIAAPEYGLAGSVDFVGKLPNGDFVIADWKRSKKLAEEREGGNKWVKQAKAPISHIEDTSLSKYFLQLNVYRHVLEKHYNLRVSKMLLTSFHPSEGDYFCCEAPIWDAEVEAILKAGGGGGGGGGVGRPPAASRISRPFST